MRDSMVFYRNFRDALARLPEKERLEAYEAIFNYAFDDIEPPDTIAGAFAQTCVPTIKKNNQRYENGKRGGRPKNQIETETKPNETKTGCKSVRVEECKNDRVPECQDGSVSECEGVASEKPKEPPKRFRPPTLEEVEAYCFERNNRVDAERFVDYYTSNGWKVGKNPMKDWKAAVRNWERKEPPDNVVRLTSAQQHSKDINDTLDRIIGGQL